MAKTIHDDPHIDAKAVHLIFLVDFPFFTCLFARKKENPLFLGGSEWNVTSQMVEMGGIEPPSNTNSRNLLRV